MAGNKLTAGTNNLLAVIGDEETVVGMLLAGVGNVDGRKSSNFFVVDDATGITVRARRPNASSARRNRAARAAGVENHTCLGIAATERRARRVVGRSELGRGDAEGDSATL